MPTRAPRVCGHCGLTHLSGEQCALVAERTKARKAKADKQRPSARARGYDAEWERARADWLAAYPSCRRCGAPATLVDHIIPIRKAPHRRLDRTNFQSLCTPCHSGHKQALDRRN
jgi:5-methylcytosine-specific restriction endonuclease McrA